MAIVYRHIRLDTNQPFYIGIGQDEKRAYSKRGRNEHWKRIVQKHGYKVHIMLDDLTWEEAQQKEIEFIQLYGRADLGLGTLVNMTDGGEGIVGLIKSEKHKALISAALIGKPLSEETRANMSAARKGKPTSEEAIAKMRAANKGKKQSEEVKAKVSAANKGRKQSEETKAKRSATLTGRKQSEKTKAKRSAALTGKKRPDISAVMKAYWAERKLKTN